MSDAAERIRAARAVAHRAVAAESTVTTLREAVEWIRDTYGVDGLEDQLDAAILKLIEVLSESDASHPSIGDAK